MTEKTRHLKNIKTGVVFVWTEQLAAHKDMRDFDFESGSVNASDTQKRSAQGPSIDMTTAMGTANVSKEDLSGADEKAALEERKREAADLVKKWFNRDVTQVTADRIKEFAMTKFNADITGTKLEMAFQIKALEEEAAK